MKVSLNKYTLFETYHAKIFERVVSLKQIELKIAANINKNLITEITLMTLKVHHIIKVYLPNSNYNYLTNLLCMSGIKLLYCNKHCGTTKRKL